jgi:hypothetical protein
MRPHRELAVDLYRVCAVALIAMGHWLAASVTYRHGGFVRENPLAELPWTQWLTWIFQVVPVFFLVAGYAGAASWTRRTDTSFGDWLGKRYRSVLGPTTAYVLVVLTAVAIAILAHAGQSVLSISGWAVAMHLWFVPVYLVVVALTPFAVAMHRRCGLLAPLALSLGVTLVDAVSVSGWLPAVGQVNNVLCWLAMFQVGIAWFFGALNGGRAVLLAAAGCAVAAAALGFGPYPVSLIGVPGQVVQNSAPPSVVMLAAGLTQAGVLIAIAPAVTRWLRNSVLRRPLAAANQRVMLVYLWHMIAVVLIAVVAYPAGFFPQPTLGTGAWWLSRLLWVAALIAVTVVVLWLVGSVRGFLADDLLSVPVALSRRYAGPVLLVGSAAASAALWYFSLRGFAPMGHFQAATALLYVGGIAVAALRPSGHGDSCRVRGAIGPYLSGRTENTVER